MRLVSDNNMIIIIMIICLVWLFGINTVLLEHVEGPAIHYNPSFKLHVALNERR